MMVTNSTMLGRQVSRPMSRIATVLRPAVSAILLVLIVLTIVFAAFSALGSDPVRNALGVNASEEAVASLRHELGYDRPLTERYLRFLAGAIQLDFGRSLHSRQPVRPALLDALGVTARNGAMALGISALLSLGLTASTFLWGKKTERCVLLICRLLTSIPSIVLAIVAGTLVYFLIGGFTAGGGLALAGIVTALAVYPTCSLAEIGVTEASRLQSATFVSAARSFGISEPSILCRCVLPVILTSWMGQVSNLAASIAVTAAVFEVVFSLPGLGSLLARSVVQNDLPVMQGVAVVIVILFLSIDAAFDRILLPRLGVLAERAEA